MGPSRLADFEGRWQLSRLIEDARAGAEGRMEGWAEFHSAEGGLVCEERGQLTFAGAAPLEASRRYLWREPGPGRIAVAFADGRPFHDFALAAAPEAAHYCAPDDYRVAYDFSRWPDWQATWRVKGPRKDYVSRSRYARVG